MDGISSDHLVQFLSDCPDGIFFLSFMSSDLFIVQTNNYSTTWTCYESSKNMNLNLITFSIYLLKT